MKILIIILIMLMTIEALSGITIIRRANDSPIHKSQIKEKDMDLYHFFIFNDSVSYLYNYNEYLVGRAIFLKCKSNCSYLIVYNPKDSSIQVASDFCFFYIRTAFIFKRNLYVVVSQDIYARFKRNRFTTILQIKEENPFKVENLYMIKHQNVTFLRSTLPNTEYSINDDFNNTIKLNKDGNLKLLISSYRQQISWFDLLFCWVPRGVGPIWEINEKTEVNMWYIFDENLNLLYTQKYIENEE